jgi:hypothetical protein
MTFFFFFFNTDLIVELYKANKDLIFKRLTILFVFTLKIVLPAHRILFIQASQHFRNFIFAFLDSIQLFLALQNSLFIFIC